MDSGVVLMLGMLIFTSFVALLIFAVLYAKESRTENTTTKANDLIQTSNTNQNANINKTNFGRFQTNLITESVYDFMDFDDIVDDMIVRKNRSQFVMVIQCSGVNYDLMSMPEKFAVEEGFVQFLNTLRFPVQLYVQSRTLNLKDIIEKYRDRVRRLSDELRKIEANLMQARKLDKTGLIDTLELQRRRKISVLEYAQNITDYVEKLSSNRNILQQKTYVVISFYPIELGGSLENYSKDEINNMCFSELYTRAQNIIGALAASQVNCKILDSEELAELLFVAYNRDESELIQISKMLDAQYDTLYSTGKDVLEKKQERLEQEINIAAIDLTTDSILNADKRKKKEEAEIEAEKNRKVKEKAMSLLGRYKTQLDPTIYEYAEEEINTANLDKDDSDKEENKVAPKKKIVRRKITKV